MLLWIFNDVIRLEFGKLFNWIQIIVQFRVQCRCFLVSFAKFLRTPYLQRLRKKCPNMEFSLVRIFLYSDWMQENAGQKNLRIWTFLMQWEHLQTTASGFFHSLFCFCHPVCHPVCQNFEHVSSRPSTSFIKRRLQDRCFPVNTAKSLKTPILKNICKSLLLKSERIKNETWQSRCSQENNCRPANLLNRDFMGLVYSLRNLLQKSETTRTKACKLCINYFFQQKRWLKGQNKNVH